MADGSRINFEEFGINELSSDDGDVKFSLHDNNNSDGAPGEASDMIAGFKEIGKDYAGTGLSSPNSKANLSRFPSKIGTAQFQQF